MAAITRDITHSIKRSDNEAIDKASRGGNKKGAADEEEEAPVVENSSSQLKASKTRAP